MRNSKQIRKTNETDISLELLLDGRGEYKIDTGLPFFNHMLELFSRHSLFDLTIKAVGDIEVDGHHTVEDIGIVLGTAFKEALQDKVGITRYASINLPMDESLAEVSVDISGRPSLVFNAPVLASGKVGEFDVELIEEFFKAFTTNSAISMHIDLKRGDNLHHVAEAIFKAVARSLREAVAISSNEPGIPSTKGVI